ncbi:MAG: hypothetical protein ABI359_00270, partial [Ginsengibacter sp.]
MKSILFFTLCIINLQLSAMDKDSLVNDKIIAHFNEKGITSIYDRNVKESISFDNENTQVLIDNVSFNCKDLTPQNVKKDNHSVTYSYPGKDYNIEIKYELLPGWRFLSKQIFIKSLNHEEFVINKIQPIEVIIKNEIKDQLQLSNGRYGISLRLRNFTEDKKGYGCFMAIQNPFSKYHFSENNAVVEYNPEMKWYKKDGTFSSDKLCIGFYDLTGITYRSSMLPEWNYVQNPD